MNSVNNWLANIHRWMLRLYPASFRQSFADDMQDVFTRAINDIDGHLPLLQFVLREVWTLPTNLIMAHWYAYTQTASLVYQGEIMMTSHPTTRLFRWTITSSLGLIGLYALLVILPFFALGLHIQPTNLVLSGHFDPKGFPIYSDSPNTENMLHVLTLLVALAAPLVGVVLSLISGIRLAKQWRTLHVKQHMMGGAALLMGASLLLFLLSPLGRTITIWMMD